VHILFLCYIQFNFYAKFLTSGVSPFFQATFNYTKSWEEILMTAKNDEYLMEATKTLYNLNADDMVRQRCQARMDAELQEQYLLKKIDALTTDNDKLTAHNDKLAADNDKLTADNAAKDAEIEALKRKLAELQ